jgi:serine protease Do
MRRLTWLAVGLLVVSGAWVTANAAEEEGVGQIRRLEVLHGAGAHLGVALRDVQAEDVQKLKLTEERGALVRDVIDDSPAEKAGIKDNDVILSFQGEAVQSAAHLARLVRETPPGRKVAIDLVRDGKAVKVTATLAEGKGLTHFTMPQFEMPVLPPDIPEWTLKHPLMMRGPVKLGIEYRQLSGQLAEFFKLAKGETGLLVEEVDPAGPAGKAGVKAGDVITKMNGQALKSSRDLKRAVAAAEPGNEIALTVLREGKPLDVKVLIGGAPSKKETPSETEKTEL